MLGLLAGLLVGITGVGGGSLMTPLLILLFGIHPPTAVGIDLLYAAATKASGSVVHGYSRNIDWKIVRRLASGSIPGAGITLFFLSYLGLDSEAVHNLITFVLGGALFLTGFVLILGDALVVFYRSRVTKLDPPRTAISTALAGATVGILVSISSVGAGAIGMIFLIMLYPQTPTVKLVGSDIAHAVPLTLLAGLGHWLLGSVDWSIVLHLLFGSVPGILIGSYFAVRLPDRILKAILAATLFLVAARVLLSPYTAKP